MKECTQMSTEMRAVSEMCTGYRPIICKLVACVANQGLLSSAAGGCAGRGFELIRQLANCKKKVMVKMMMMMMPILQWVGLHRWRTDGWSIWWLAVVTAGQ